DCAAGISAAARVCTGVKRPGQNRGTRVDIVGLSKHQHAHGLITRGSSLRLSADRESVHSDGVVGCEDHLAGIKAIVLSCGVWQRVTGADAEVAGGEIIRPCVERKLIETGE